MANITTLFKGCKNVFKLSSKSYSILSVFHRNHSLAVSNAVSYRFCKVIPNFEARYCTISSEKVLLKTNSTNFYALMHTNTLCFSHTLTAIILNNDHASEYR